MILCICQRGAVRSATLAIVLRDLYGKNDVFSTGLDTTSPNQMRSWISQAHSIYICGDGDLFYRFYNVYADSILHTGGDRVKHIDVGVDKWMLTMHPGLVDLIVDKLEQTDIDKEYPIYGSAENYKLAHRLAFGRNVTV